MKENKPPVAFFASFHPTNYSGGRIHAMLMAEAFSELGYETHIFCNVVPGLASDFEAYPHHREIIWHPHPDMRFPIQDRHYKWVVFVPHRGSGWYGYDFYLQAAKTALKSGAGVIFLNFESSSFFNSCSRFSKDPREWKLWYRFAKYADIVLSSTQLSNQYAVGDYCTKAVKPNFEYCYPSINSITAKAAMEGNVKRQIIIFCRWVDPHKNSYSVLKVLSADLEGYEVIIVSGVGEIPKAFIESIEKKARKHNFGYRIVEYVDEHEKFKMIAESKAMIFLSEFEGFGLPPVEAQYCGVPCVCFDLPVLREVSQGGLIYAKCGDYDGIKRGVRQALGMSAKERADLQKNIAHVADFKNYCLRLEQVLVKYRPPLGNSNLRLFRRMAYLGENATRVVSRFTARAYGSQPESRRDVTLSVAFLENYVKARWENLSFQYGEKKILVFGVLDYCTWLHDITWDENKLNVAAFIEGHDDYELMLWGKKIFSNLADLDSGVDAVILATECFQEKYAKRCRELFGDIEVMDLYAGMPSGPYRKKID